MLQNMNLGFLNNFNKKDDGLFGTVSEEMENGFIDKALWTKATANANGNEKLIQSLYIKYRVKNLQQDRFIKSEKEIHDKQSDERKLKNENRGAEKLLIIERTTAEVKKITKLLISGMFIFGVVALAAGLLDQSLNETANDYSATGLILIILSVITLIPLIFLNLAKNVHEERGNLNILFLGFLIFLIVGIPVIFLSTSSAMFSFPLLILFLYLIKKAISYNIAYEFALKHKLISK